MSTTSAAASESAFESDVESTTESAADAAVGLMFRYVPMSSALKCVGSSGVPARWFATNR